MKTPELPGTDPADPTPWFFGKFGAHSVDVMAALIAAGYSAHERSLDAKAGSQLKSNDAYGSFWLSLREEIVSNLRFLPGVDKVRPTRGRYELPLYNGMVLFGSKVPVGTDPDKIKLKNSGVTKSVFSLEGRGVSDQPLDFSSLGYEETQEDYLPPLPASFSNATSLLYLAFECSARAGLRRVSVGDATLLDDGHVRWLHREELPLAAFSADWSVPRLVDDAPPRRFDDGPIPAVELSLRDAEGEAEGAGEA